jgi:hypothetical protein
MKTGVSLEGSSWSMAAANRALTARYAAQSLLRNFGRTSTWWHSGQRPSLAKPL